MNPKNNSERNWPRIMYFASLIFPIIGFTAVALQIVASGFIGNFIGAGLALCILIFFISRYLYRRSKNLQAVFMTVRVHSGEQPVGGLFDKMIIFAGVFFVFVAIFLPILRSENL